MTLHIIEKIVDLLHESRVTVINSELAERGYSVAISAADGCSRTNPWVLVRVIGQAQEITDAFNALYPESPGYNNVYTMGYLAFVLEDGVVKSGFQALLCQVQEGDPILDVITSGVEKTDA